MKRVAFLNRLKKLNGEFKVNKDGHIRTKKQYTCCRAPKNLCPLEALSIKDGIASYFWHAEKLLKIDNELGTMIISSADNNLPNSKTKQMREDMLSVLGLKEKRKKK